MAPIEKSSAFCKAAASVCGKSLIETFLPVSYY